MAWHNWLWPPLIGPAGEVAKLVGEKFSEGTGINKAVDSFSRTNDRLAESGNTLFESMNGILTQAGGMAQTCSGGLTQVVKTGINLSKWVMIALAIALILALFSSITIRSYHKARNNPQALERLKLLQEHRERMAEAKSKKSVSMMSGFD